MKIKKEPEEIWREYEDATEHNKRLFDGRGLYDTVEENERYYTGDQWHGVDAPDLDKPVLNFMKRVVSYDIAMLASDDISVQLTPFGGDERAKAGCTLLEDQIARVIERTKLKTQAREALRNAAVDGDADWYIYFDPEGGTGAVGELALETVENTKLLFGNPYTTEVQTQPYILIPRRTLREELIGIAESDGMSRDEAEEITPDNETLYGEQDGEKLVTSVVKLWRENGTVHWLETVRDKVIRKERDTGYRLYPVAHMCWERIRNSYHGQAVITGMLPNQRFVNKSWALMMAWLKGMALPKVFYNAMLLPDGWDSRLEAIGVMGAPDEVVAQNYRPPEISTQVMTLVEKTISYTKDCMGANDAALGNVTPTNTSAIIAVQRASAAPLELQKLAYYQFIEDAVRIIAEIIRCDYGQRWVTAKAEDGTEVYGIVDFGALDLDSMEINVEVGASAYWSQLTQIQSADALFSAGVIKDAVDYLEQLPDGIIRDKQGLVKKLEEQREQMTQAAAQGGGAVDLAGAVGQSVPQMTGV